MFQQLFGTELDLPVRVSVAVVVIAALLGLTVVLFRRIGRDSRGLARGRQARLSIEDSLTIDQRRRLVLVRRDDVEHLILIGGTADLVVEPGIGRRDMVAAQGRDAGRDTGREIAREPLRDLPPREPRRAAALGAPAVQLPPQAAPHIAVPPVAIPAGAPVEALASEAAAPTLPPPVVGAPAPEPAAEAPAAPEPRPPFVARRPPLRDPARPQPRPPLAAPEGLPHGHAIPGAAPFERPAEAEVRPDIPTEPRNMPPILPSRTYRAERGPERVQERGQERAQDRTHDSGVPPSPQPSPFSSRPFRPDRDGLPRLKTEPRVEEKAEPRSEVRSEVPAEAVAEPRVEIPAPVAHGAPPPFQAEPSLEERADARPEAVPEFRSRATPVPPADAGDAADAVRGKPRLFARRPAQDGRLSDMAGRLEAALGLASVPLPADEPPASLAPEPVAPVPSTPHLALEDLLGPDDLTAALPGRPEPAPRLRPAVPPAPGQPMRPRAYAMPPRDAGAAPREREPRSLELPRRSFSERADLAPAPEPEAPASAEPGSTRWEQPALKLDTEAFEAALAEVTRFDGETRREPAALPPVEPPATESAEDDPMRSFELEMANLLGRKNTGGH